MLCVGDVIIPLAKLADTGHRGQMSAEPIVGIQFGHNEQRKSQPAWMGSRLEFRYIELSGYRETKGETGKSGDSGPLTLIRKIV